METSELQNALAFSTLFENKIQNNVGLLLAMVTTFSEKYDAEIEKLPFHINIIDELHANENAHSRIFAQLLRYNKRNKYPFLESFVNDLCGFTLNIENPVVEKVDSCGRIDIPIFDNNYVLLIENKVTDQAPDQNTSEGGQLVRYVESVINTTNYKEKEIFVIYTPKYSREPSDDCWINKNGVSVKEKFKDRFRSVSYKDKIYPWLKECKKLILDQNDFYLQSAIDQYVDHLEGIFSLREINKNMNTTLQEFLKEQLQLDDSQPENAIDLLRNKRNELSAALNQIETLKTKYQNEIVLKAFNIWKSELKRDFPQYKIVEDDIYYRTNTYTLGILFEIEGNRFSALVECIIGDYLKTYFGISCTYTKNEKCEIPESLKNILEKNSLGQPERFWYGWKYTDISKGYTDLHNLIRQIEP